MKMTMLDAIFSMKYMAKNDEGAGNTFDVAKATIEDLESMYLLVSSDFLTNLAAGKEILREFAARNEPFPHETHLTKAVFSMNRAETKVVDLSDDAETEDSFVLKGRGPRGALVAFVGSSPSKLDEARGKFFSGPIAKTIRDKYLEPFGLNESQVFFTNLVPEYLEDEFGNPREPTSEEIEKWSPFAKAELEHAAAPFVVALGKTARAAMEGTYTEWMPHPRAIEQYGDSGEVGRKMQRLLDTVNSYVTKSASSIDASIAGYDTEKRLVYGIVLEPEAEDTDGNWTSADEIEKAAHYWMENSRTIGHEHLHKLEGVAVVESYVAPSDMSVGETLVKKGTWILGVKVYDEDRWEMVKSGEYTGFSIGGRAVIDPEKTM